MVHRVSPDRVFDHCSKPVNPVRASELIRELRGLAPYWLRDRVLRSWNSLDPGRAFRLPWKPNMTTAPGSCWIVYANRAPRELCQLRQALLLPLQWLRDTEHSPYLPQHVPELANGVLRVLGLQGWGLHLSEPVQDLDLGGVNSQAESGWAAVAGGLLVAAEGGQPQADVWATGRWTRYGIDAVGGLRAKLRLARRFGAKQVFVPGCQVERVEKLATPPRIGRLATGFLQPREALQDYLASLKAPPPATAPWEQRWAYYRSLPLESSQRLGYYRSHFRPEIVHRLRQQVEIDWRGQQFTHLVTIVSDGSEVTPLTAVAFDVARVLLLHTRQFDSTVAGLQSELRQLKASNGMQVEAVAKTFSDGDTMAATIRDHMRAFLTQAVGHQVVVDLTPGRKDMCRCLEKEALHLAPESLVVYLKHEQSHRRIKPGNERFVLW